MTTFGMPSASAWETNLFASLYGGFVTTAPTENRSAPQNQDSRSPRDLWRRPNGPRRGVRARCCQDRRHIPRSLAAAARRVAVLERPRAAFRTDHPCARRAALDLPAWQDFGSCHAP